MTLPLCTPPGVRPAREYRVRRSDDAGLELPFFIEFAVVPESAPRTAWKPIGPWYRERADAEAAVRRLCERLA